MRWPLGVVDIVYGDLESVPERAEAARADGFAHIDPLVEFRDQALALPIGCPTAFPKPTAGWCATPAPPATAGPDGWERALRWWRACPSALLEPWPGAAVATIEEVWAFAAEIPGLRLCVDTGHVAALDGDLHEYLAFAAHVQFRQGCPGDTQLHIDDERGTVDFGAVVRDLNALGYDGLVSIEYFDLPDQGWPLDDPRQWARDLAANLGHTGA